MFEFLMDQQSIFIPSIQVCLICGLFRRRIDKAILLPNYGFTAAAYTQIVYNAHDLQPSLTSLMIQHVVYKCAYKHVQMLVHLL